MFDLCAESKNSTNCWPEPSVAGACVAVQTWRGLRATQRRKIPARICWFYPQRCGFDQHKQEGLTVNQQLCFFFAGEWRILPVTSSDNEFRIWFRSADTVSVRNYLQDLNQILSCAARSVFCAFVMCCFFGVVWRTYPLKVAILMGKSWENVLFSIAKSPLIAIVIWLCQR